jgi:hypothetical protein
VGGGIYTEGRGVRGVAVVVVVDDEGMGIEGFAMMMTVS